MREKAAAVKKENARAPREANEGRGIKNWAKRKQDKAERWWLTRGLG